MGGTWLNNNGVINYNVLLYLSNAAVVENESNMDPFDKVLFREFYS